MMLEHDINFQHKRYFASYTEHCTGVNFLILAHAYEVYEVKARLNLSAEYE